MNSLTTSVPCDILLGTKGCDRMDPAGEIIRRMIEQRGISVSELAKRVGKAQNTVSTALKSSNMMYENFADYVEALGYDIVFEDKDGGKLPSKSKKKRYAPPTTIVIGRCKYSTMTAEPILCVEQSDNLFAELYRKAKNDYFIVYFEKDSRGTVNPISIDAARSFWRQYKPLDETDDELD